MPSCGYQQGPTEGELPRSMVASAPDTKADAMGGVEGYAPTGEQNRS